MGLMVGRVVRVIDNLRLVDAGNDQPERRRAYEVGDGLHQPKPIWRVMKLTEVAQLFADIPAMEVHPFMRPELQFQFVRWPE